MFFHVKTPVLICRKAAAFEHAFQAAKEHFSTLYE
jgi:hypothetical protein